MDILIRDGLPTIKLKICYRGKEKILNDVLIDTGSSNTIFDVDSVVDIGLVINPTGGKARRMYGVGGESELCYEQKVDNITLGDYMLDNFTIQLGMLKENYDFDCILGVDFMIKNSINIDFKNLIIR